MIYKGSWKDDKKYRMTNKVKKIFSSKKTNTIIKRINNNNNN